jgi:hypothetical protein
MKTCSQCSVAKPLSEYHTKDKSGVKKAYCKDCAKLYRKKYYTENRDKAIQYAIESNKEKKKKLASYVYEYLKTHSCIDCGENDPVVLEFDHRDTVTKKANVSELVMGKSSLTKLQEEINKCDVRCANCHRRKTAMQFGWWITRM